MARGFRKRLKNAFGRDGEMPLREIVPGLITNPTDTQINVVRALTSGDRGDVFFDALEDLTPNPMDPIGSVTDIVPYVAPLITAAIDIAEPGSELTTIVPPGPGPGSTIRDIVDAVNTAKDVYDTVKPVVNNIKDWMVPVDNPIDNNTVVTPSTGITEVYNDYTNYPTFVTPSTTTKNCYTQCRDMDKAKQRMCQQLNRKHEMAMKQLGCPGTKCKTKNFAKTCTKSRSKRCSKYKKTCSCKH